MWKRLHVVLFGGRGDVSCELLRPGQGLQATATFLSPRPWACRLSRDWRGPHLSATGSLDSVRLSPPSSLPFLARLRRSDIPQLGLPLSLPPFLSQISATYKWKLGSQDQGRKTFRLLNYFLQRNSPFQRKQETIYNQKHTPGTKYLIVTFPTGVWIRSPREGPGCLGPNYLALNIACFRPCGITHHL